jgi:DNA-binding MarR family transcriptional regulator
LRAGNVTEPKRTAKQPTSVGFWTHRVWNAYAADMQRRLRPHGLTAAQGVTLSIIGHQQPVDVRGVADLIGLSPPAVVRQLDALEARGLIRRETDPADARRRLLTLTGSGSELFGRAAAHLRAVQERSLEGFSPEERRLLTALLRRVEENLKGRR